MELLRLAIVFVAGFPQQPPAAAAASPEVKECLRCHPQVEAALHGRVVHAAIKSGCATCHRERRLRVGAQTKKPFLNSPEPGLCLDCHPSGPHLTAAHYGQPVDATVCTHCHNPHGSNNPKLIREHMHGPFAGRHCDECHGVPQAGKVTLVAASIKEVCYGCHVQLKNRLAVAVSRHRWLDSGACTVCHDPHASDFPRMLRASTNDLCLECHGAGVRPGETVVLFNGRVKLPGALLGGLRPLPIEAGHPVPKHPVLLKAAAGQREINCLSCHTPHGSDANPKMLVAAAAELCVKCHSRK